ncbi:ASCH domain-containing protein [Streptomyces spororaveus]|uniref:ASCH domain-containing protein n=1 Tax=Streptomyces spororaveus TaxID=284039 RepID=UPI00378809CC
MDHLTTSTPILTIRQPWATLIASGAKDVECRSYPTHYRGPLFIHAGLGWDGEGRRPDGVPHRAILGRVIITGCTRTSASSWAESGMWHWELDEPVVFDPPVFAMTGRLAFWYADADLGARLAEAEAALHRL